MKWHKCLSITQITWIKTAGWNADMSCNTTYVQVNNGINGLMWGGFTSIGHTVLCQFDSSTSRLVFLYKSLSLPPPVPLMSLRVHVSSKKRNNYAHSGRGHEGSQRAPQCSPHRSQTLSQPYSHMLPVSLDCGRSAPTVHTSALQFQVDPWMKVKSDRAIDKPASNKHTSYWYNVVFTVQKLVSLKPPQNQNKLCLTN